MSAAGKVALLTGGASGFGAEVAHQLSRRGDSVVLLDVDVEGGERVAREVGGQFLRCDVSSYDEVMAATADAEQVHGRLDLIFLNAGIAGGCGVDEDFELALYRRAMGINLDGVVFGVHAALPALRRRGGGSIVCTASLAGLTGTAFDPIYGANKHAVVGLVRALGPTLAPQGITINAFCPGFAQTKIIGPMAELLQASGVPIIPVEQAGETVVRMFDSTDTGQAWLLQAGREGEPYRFRGIPGPLNPDGSKANPADPTGAPHP